MYQEITRLRQFRMTCDYCGRVEIVEVHGGTREAYAQIMRQGWDISGPYDRCPSCVIARAETVAKAGA